ncbi:MAG TPA: PAS domain S-box protein, partial [Gemmatimonadaceae bacterium]|nr:PAS domain S-box protein [Gemmatimonadaceae bacterium]
PPEIRQKKAIAEYKNAAGTRVLSLVSPIAYTPWALALEFPRAPSLQPVQAMMERVAVFAVLLLILAAVGAWLMSGTLTRPIAELARAANAFTVSGHTERANVRLGDEIGVLGVAFNGMVDRLREGRASVEAKVAELAEAESRYRTLFDLSPQPMWVYDVKTRRFLAVNAAAVQRYGYSREEFLAMTILDIRPLEEVPALLSNLSELGDDGAADFALKRHRARDGSSIDVEVSSRALTFAGRRARLVLANDLTNRRRAEESLIAAQQRLERVIGSSGAVLYELRLESRGPVLEWISDNVTKILGYDSTEVKAPRWWTNNVHPSDRARFGERSETSGIGREALHDGACEYRFRHRDGRYRLLREDQRLVADGVGKAKKVIGAWMDLTEQRQLEAQLRQAQKMEAIGRLAGGVAHDFNNLLTVILAECQYLLGDSSLAPDVRTECIDQIFKAGERAALLTRQLLAFSRQQLVEPTTLDLNVVVTDVDKMLRRLIGEDVDLRVSLSRDSCITVVDRGQLEQVVVNLVVNARDAMPVGGVLTIETGRTYLDRSYAESHADVLAGDYVLLAVSDTGTGMDDEVKTHIFEPFFTTKDESRGTGLGLATCYAIARQYGGHIAAYSELGFGTTMKVYLPNTSGVPSAPPAVDFEAARGTETVMLVEDDAHVRRLTARMLEEQGYTVIQARDASDALEALDGHPETVHLLLTDVVLPGMGGRSLADRVLERRPDIAVLFASGYSDDVILQHRLTAHGVVMLHKPFTSDALSRKVREALARPGVV